MNRTTFLFLALLIGSCIMTVNSRNESRNLITEKAVLNDKVTALQETIRRLELEKARVSARNTETGKEASKDAAAPVAKVAPAKAAPAPAATADKDDL
jgi:cell division protein FtsL